MLSFFGISHVQFNRNFFTIVIFAMRVVNVKAATETERSAIAIVVSVSVRCRTRTCCTVSSGLW